MIKLLLQYLMFMIKMSPIFYCLRGILSICCHCGAETARRHCCSSARKLQAIAEETTQFAFDRK